mmetsp:Transcript_17877/g.23310  ORF Transcript_17877/g.23310 Transcript_17877/m.23310 type:complete len:249 (-) Transcript_17877:155-901(-)
MKQGVIQVSLRVILIISILDTATSLMINVLKNDVMQKRYSHMAPLLAEDGAAESSDEIEAFRRRMTSELTESGPENDVLEAARKAGEATTEALRSNRRVIVDCRAQELEATGNLRDEWLTEFRQACTVEANLWFSPDDLVTFRSQVSDPLVVINPRFAIDPIELDRAVTAYAIWPLRLRAVGGEDGIRLCVFRRFPRPWALYLAPTDDDEYVKVFNFPGDEPPSDAAVREAALDALKNINRYSSSSSS